MSALNEVIERVAENPQGTSVFEITDAISNFDSENKTEQQKIVFFVKSLFDLALKGECSISIDALFSAVYSNQYLHFIFKEIDLEEVSKNARDTETFRIIEWLKSFD
jgi:hypothetical protein